jgi:hypothetical protein
MNIDEFKNLEQWAVQQWGQAQLGDARRTQRAIAMGQALAANPDASLPEQIASWSDLKAAYRLLGEADVSHAALSQPHWEKTCQQAKTTGAGVVLFVQDTSELDYTRHTKTQNLGHIGDGKGKGLMLHSCLAVVPMPDKVEILGLAAQRVWRRMEVKRGTETRTERAYRRSESDVWAEVVEAIGRAPTPETQALWVSVGDRGSDIFSYLRRARVRNWHCLFRVCQDRVIWNAKGEKGRLMQVARAMPAMAEKTMVLRGRDGEPKQSVVLQVAWSRVQIVPPVRGTERHQVPQPGWCIRVWQATNSPDALEWILFTTVPISDTHCALAQVDWYATRWVIEEYHKCLKTGCAVERRQLTTAEGLERLLGFLAIVAVRLLQLRTLARSNPAWPAQSYVPQGWLTVLAAKLTLPRPPSTLGEFWCALARLGGFIGRKNDGKPGWQTLWRGWVRLQDLCWGATLAAKGI